MLFRRPCSYSGINLNQDKATKPQTVQIVRQGEAPPYWFKVNPLYLRTGLKLIHYIFHSNFEHIRFQIKKPLSDRGFSIFQKPDYFNLVSL
ncbi:hypothetical protein HMPREF3156_01189 [Neisseria sp. HMSC06F02]|nr:hypothetical protein HMPREF3156_01189 [Neisseria sp. HMSC06F02]